MKILLVDDDDQTAEDIITGLSRFIDVNRDTISRATNVVDALKLLSEHKYNLLLLDLALPMRSKEEPLVDGGKKILRDISASDSYVPPDHIIGITSYDEAI